jgi:hypothetical protein
MCDAPRFERLLSRDRIITFGAVAALGLLAWLYVLSGAGLGMRAWEMTTLSLFPHREAGAAMMAMPSMDESMWRASLSAILPRLQAFHDAREGNRIAVRRTVMRHVIFRL